MAKWTDSHVKAMFRQGLKELRAALYPDSNVAQPAEYGLYGTRTPGEVAEARRDNTLDLEQESSRLPAGIEQRLEQNRTRGDEGREKDREVDRQ